MRIVIAGCSGFIGTRLSSYLSNEGHDLVLLSRTPKSSHMHFWNPEAKELDPTLLEGADAIINLAGENILGRWNQKKMNKIRNSRMEATQLISNRVMQLKSPPKIFINASAVGYYGDRKEEVLDETSPHGEGFLAEVCQDWEKIAETLSTKTRVVLARFGMVFGSDGGALQLIEKAFRSGLGGILGSGKQMMSWIAIEDVCSAMVHTIEHTELKGPINFVSPKAISNFDFTQTLGKVLNRPTMFNVPKFALNMFLGEGAEMLLASTHVYPKRLLESGYQFQYSNLETVLKKYLRNLQD